MSEENKVHKISLYGHNFSMNSGLHDFILNFQELDTTNMVDQSVSTKNSVSITLSPSHLKQIIEILENNVSAYEQNFGEIPVIDETVLKRLESEGKVTRNEPRN